VFQYMDTASAALGFGASRRSWRISRSRPPAFGGTGRTSWTKSRRRPSARFTYSTATCSRPQRLPGARRSLPRRPEDEAEEGDLPARHLLPDATGTSFPHAYPVDQNTVGELAGMHFVFLCVDKGAIKELIVGYLEQRGSRSSTWVWASMRRTTRSTAC